MAVKRERPNQGIPGQLHTSDGLVVKIRLPGEPEPESEAAAEPPDTDEAPEDDDA